MDVEKREGFIDLEQKLDTHIERFDSFEEDLLTVIAGHKDPLTKQRTGGMRGEIGQMRMAQQRFEVQASNGGINTKWSFWQKVVVGVAPFLVGGGFAIVTSLIENG
jgi:hypothetical protein